MSVLTLQTSQGGPLVDLLVGVSAARQQALTQAQLPVPNRINIRGLVDTGASCSCVDPTILQTLGLSPTSRVMVHSVTTEGQPQEVNEYDVSLVLLHPSWNMTISAIPVIASQISLQNMGYEALIGRDVLENCLLIYDGQAGTFTLAF